MFRFLKGLGREKEAPPELGLADLPGWIGAEEEKVRGELATAVAGHRRAVLGAIDRLGDTLAEFDEARMEDVAHAKLAGVTERSLPLFQKAMKTSLSRDLPPEPEAFYAAAGEILKGCLSAFRGQGRYLASRFPAEMKALREGVDAIGREVNALTPAISRARDRLGRLAGLRASLAAYGGAKDRAARAGEEIRALEGELAGSRKALGGVTHDLADLEGSSDFREYEAELGRIRGMGEELGDLTRRYRAGAAGAVHLLKKGEKVASRNQDRVAVRAIREAVDLLEMDPPLAGEDAQGVISRGLAALATMAASGDLVPKTREEGDLAGSPATFVERLSGLSRKSAGISGSIASARDSLLSLPAVKRKDELERERERLEKDITSAEARLPILRGDVTDLENRITGALGEVRKGVDTLSGGSVKIR